MSPVLRKLGPVLAGVLLLAAPLHAQRVDSSRLVELHINAEADNKALTGTVVEGQGFQISFDGIGSFELVPVVLDEDAGTVRVTVYKGALGAEMSDMRIVETVTAQRGVPIALRSMPSVGLVVDGIRRISPAR